MVKDRMMLSTEQEEILNGSKGQVMAKVMETMIRYGELFGAESMVPITSKCNHLVTSFGLKALGPVYDLMEKLIDTGCTSVQNLRQIQDLWTKMCRVLLYRIWYSGILCTANRITMKTS